MKDWIKLNSAYLIIISILVSVIFLQKCGVKHTDNTINQAEINQVVNHVKDSLKTVHYTDLIYNYQAGQKAEAVKTNEYKRKALTYKSESERLKHISDSIINKYGLDTICKKIVTAKQAEIDTLNNTVKIVGQEAESYSRQLYLCEKQSTFKDTIILNKNDLLSRTNDINAKLAKELKAKNNWVERNKIWIGVIAGAVGMYLIKK
jgi:hypothetical protein